MPAETELAIWWFGSAASSAVLAAFLWDEVLNLRGAQKAIFLCVMAVTVLLVIWRVDVWTANKAENNALALMSQSAADSKAMGAANARLHQKSSLTTTSPEDQNAKRPRPPFAVQIETVGLSLHPKSQTEATGFWVAYISDNYKTLSPARMFMYLRITNLQDHPVMITKYSVKIGNIKMIKISGPPTESFYDGHGNIHSVCWIDDSDLFDKNLSGLVQPAIPVQGLALFDYPDESRPESLNESDSARMRFTITIVDAEGRSFTSKPLQPTPDPSNEAVQSRIVRFNRGVRDLSAFKIKDFKVSRGFTSPPF